MWPHKEPRVGDPQLFLPLQAWHQLGRDQAVKGDGAWAARIAGSPEVPGPPSAPFTLSSAKSSAFAGAEGAPTLCARHSPSQAPPSSKAASVCREVKKETGQN